MKHPVALVLGLLPALAALAACATDNGPNVFGPAYGPNDGKDGSASSSSSSSGGGGDPDGGSPADGGREGGGGDASSPCASGTVAILAGSDAALSGAVQDKGGAWTGAAIAGGAARSKPALVAFGQGFLGVTRGTGDALQSTAYTTSWGAVATFGKPNVKGPPALAVAGTSAHVVYAAGPGANRDFFHGIHDGNAWNAADATVGTSPDQSFGTVGAGLAGAGNTAVFVENGTDHKLYTRTYDGGWPAGPGTAIAGAATVGTDFPTPPVVVGATGKYDLVAIYVQETTLRLSYAMRDATSKTWSNGGVVHDFATTEEPFSAARIGQSTFVVAFRGQDGKGYYAQGTVDAGGTFMWNAAQPVGGAATTVDSAPAVARGVCGDDAVVAYAQGGAIKATRLRGTTWTSAESVTGASGTRVAIATK